jgi:hypothetical protein
MATRRIRDILILGRFALIAGGAPIGPVRAASGQSPAADEKASQALKQDWLGRWERHILADACNHYCDKELGEEIGWRVSPFENGFLEGTRRRTRRSGWTCSSTGEIPGLPVVRRSPTASSAGPSPRAPAPARFPASPPITCSARRWGCVPYDETLRTIFEANHNPASWGGLSTTSWYLARMERK